MVFHYGIDEGVRVGLGAKCSLDYMYLMNVTRAETFFLDYVNTTFTYHSILALKLASTE